MSAVDVSGDRRAIALAAPRARPHRDRSIWIAAGITALAAGLRFVELGHQGFWFDEANTALLVHLRPGAMLGLIPQSESTPPLYYLVAWVWGRIFGFNEAGLRSLSALAGVLTVPVLFAVGRRAVSARAGVIAAALAAANPLLIWYSQEARSYSLLVLLSSVSLLCALRVADVPSPRRAVTWAAAAALALVTHYYAILVVAGEAVWLVTVARGARRAPGASRARGCRRRDDAGERPLLVAVGVVLLCGLALVPLALGQASTGHGNWIAGATLSRRLSQVVPQFLAAFQPPADGVLVPLAGAVAALALALAAWRGEGASRRAMIGFAAVALGGLALNLLIVALATDDVLTRNLLALWPPAALTVAAACAGTRPRWAGVAAAVVLCAVGVTSAVAVDVNRDLERPDWRAVARALGSHPAGDGPRLILVQHDRDLLPLSLYLPGLRWAQHTGATVREFDVVSVSDPASGGFCWWGSACNLYPSAMQPSYRLAGFRALSRRRVYRFTVLRLLADRPTRVSAREVSRALTATTLGRDELLLEP